MQIPHAEPGLFCPLHKKDQSNVCHKCPWWIQLRGKDPTGTKEIDHWGCAVSFMPILQIETAQQSRQTGAAVESFRNEVIKRNDSQIAFNDAKLIS